MKKTLALLLALALALSPAIAFAAVARVQATTGKNTTFASSVATTAFASPLTNGSLIFVCAEFDGVTTWNTGNTPTDTAGNTYVRITDTLQSGVFDSMSWYALNTHTTASDVITITDKGGGVDSTSAAEEWTGLQAATPIDKTASSTGVSTALNSGNITPVNSGDLIMGCGAAAISGNHLSLAGSYTNLNQTSTTFSNIGDATQVQAVAAAIAGTLTVSSSVSWNMAVVSFIAAASTPATITTPHAAFFTKKAAGYLTYAASYFR